MAQRKTYKPGEFHSEYFGYSIYRMPCNSWGGKWESGRLRADTLNGLRSLIRTDCNLAKH